jgi:hypothetical protein
MPRASRLKSPFNFSRFQRYHPIQARVAGLVHPTHATRPNGREDFVDLEAGAKSETGRRPRAFGTATRSGGGRLLSFLAAPKKNCRDHRQAGVTR